MVLRLRAADPAQLETTYRRSENVAIGATLGSIVATAALGISVVPETANHKGSEEQVTTSASETSRP